MSDEMREKVRDVIANTVIGVPFKNLMETKREWVSLGGMKNGQWRDVNDPHQCDVTEATDAILSLITAELERVERERDDAIKLMSQYATEAGFAKGKLEMSEAAGVVDMWREHAQAAEARATAAEARLAEAVEVMREVEPFIDVIVCYASSIDEYEPNRIAKRLHAFMEQQG